MATKIKDEFSDLPISKQRKYQLRRKRDKRCTLCGAPAEQGSLCLKHQTELRERMRKISHSKRRYKNSMSYRLEKAS
jgi:hypothetical protein